MSTPVVPEEFSVVASTSAARFLNEETSLEFIGHGESLTYGVNASSGKYFLRLHVPLSPPATPELAMALTAPAIESECAWLRSLSDETELVVPRPVTSPTGGYVLRIPFSEPPAPVLCTLLAWVEGEVVQGKRTEEQARRLGALLAALHAHAASWERPPGFLRPTHGAASRRAALPRIDELVSLGIVSSAAREMIARAVDQLDHDLIPLEGQADRVGLIHADLHESNYVFHRGDPRPIDFGHCGFGPWLYDLAVCLAHLGPRRRRDLVDAYSERRPLGDDDPRLIEGYFVANLIEIFGHHAPNPDEHEFLAQAVPAWAPHIQDYVERSPFLFDL